MTAAGPISEAVLLAAGLGTRLRPLTKYRPKPLFPLLKEPILHWWLTRLQAAGIRRTVINVHHLAGQIISYVSQVRSQFRGMEISLSLEETLLGTGGGIRQAARDFEGPFYVFSSDIYTDWDWTGLGRAYQARPPAEKASLPAVIAVRFQGRPATVRVDGDLIITGLREEGTLQKPDRLAQGLGLMLLGPNFRDWLAPGVSDVILELKKVLHLRPRALAAEETAFWTDIGTVGSYLDLLGRLAGDCPAGDRPAGNRISQGEGSRLLGRAEGFLILGAGSVLEEGALAVNSAVWPGVTVGAGAVLRQAAAAADVPPGLEI
ncbi:MAG: NTP transferase domain-containing protein, partial [Deltaproteobacteria bacterium]|nr:NTP transferase domain-containing protein [Deltaproteobacteria bacterium]